MDSGQTLWDVLQDGKVLYEDAELFVHISKMIFTLIDRRC